MTFEEFIEKKLPHFDRSVTLLVLSELIHCKSYLSQYLQHNLVRQCYTLVNELFPNMLIDERLRISGGKLYDPKDLCPAVDGWIVIPYTMYFKYYCALRGPVA